MYIQPSSFSYPRGEHVVKAFTVGNGTTDITGWSIAVFCTRRPGLSAIFVRTTDPDGGVEITNGPAGQFELTLPYEITASTSVPAGQYIYEVWRTDTGNEAPIAHVIVFAEDSSFPVNGPPIPFPTTMPATVPQGGTGATSFTSGTLLGGNGVAPIAEIIVGIGLDLTGNTLTATAAPAVTGNTLWVDAVNGDDATGTRGRADKPYLTLTAAKAAALAGDEIVVRPGSYTVTAALAKDRVGWEFEPGVSLSRSDDTTAGLWDDNGVAMVATLVGAADLSRSAASAETSTLRVVNAASDVSVQARSIMAAPSGTGTIYAINQQNGLLTVEADLIGTQAAQGAAGVPTAVWWANGSMQIQADRIVNRDGQCLYTSCSAAPTGECNVRANEIVGYSPLSIQGTNTTAGVWVDALTVRGTDTVGNTEAVGYLSKNRFYLTCQKVFGRVGMGTGAGGPAYISTQKWSAIATGTTGAPGLLKSSSLFNTGSLIVEIQEADPAGFSGEMFVVDGGTVEIRGMRYTANAGSNGVTVTGGTVRLINCRIDTSANNTTNPITVSGGTVELVNCTLIAAPGRDAISAATPQTVIITGTLTANTAPNANVTLSGGMLVRSDIGAVTIQGTKITTPFALVIGDSSSPAPTTTQGIAVGPQNTLSGTGLNLVAVGVANTVSSSQNYNAAIGVANTIGGTASSSFCFGISNVITGAAQASVVGTNHNVNGRQLVYALGNGATFTQDFSVALGQAPASDTIGSLVFGGFIYDPVFQLQKFSSTNDSRHVGGLIGTYADPTDAIRTGRVSVVAYYVTTAQAGITVEANAAGVRIGFNGSPAIAKPTITGSRGGNAALASLLTALANYGLITDSTTA